MQFSGMTSAQDATSRRWIADVCDDIGASHINADVVRLVGRFFAVTRGRALPTCRWQVFLAAAVALVARLDRADAVLRLDRLAYLSDGQFTKSQLACATFEMAEVLQWHLL